MPVRQLQLFANKLALYRRFRHYKIADTPVLEVRSTPPIGPLMTQGFD